MSDLQHRREGEIKFFASLREALEAQPFDKVSFEIEGGRLILRGDGMWEFWDEHGRWSSTGIRSWVATP